MGDRLSQERLLRRLGALLDDHVGRTCTAAVLHVVHDGPRIELARGVLDPESDARPVTGETPFDLASITKLFTASAVLRAVADGRLALDDSVGDHLTEFKGSGKESVSVRHLLTHASGLPALIRLFGPEAPEGDPWATILRMPLEREPGACVVYSDVGFMVLGRLVETVYGTPLRAAVQESVLDPLELRGTGFGPCFGAPATERDPWRARRIQGEVHDENCWVLGGASGHAGLFGPARDVASLASAYLEDEGRFLPRPLAAVAVAEQAVSNGERRGLGWKLRSPDPAASERSFSVQSFGHYGFTGTAVWTDPTRRVTVVLLTNRVYFGRSSEDIQRLRRQVFEAVSGEFP